MKYRKSNIASVMHWFIISVVALSFTSCLSSEKLTYVHNGDDFNIKNSYFNERPARKVRPYDDLYIKILSIEGKSVVSLLDAESGQPMIGGMNLIYYQVNDSGEINIPFIKDIKIGGLSLSEAKNLIEKELSGYLDKPSVIIKFVNLQVTVLGEVNHPGTFPYYKEPINIFQAIGLAGDISQYGDKSEIIIQREENNLITYNTVDLTDKKIAESYFYYLKPGDVIIVQSVDAKFYGKGAISYQTVLTTITTLLAVLYFYQSQVYLR
ncbi:MAG: polysaccharide biosynthesis/export family protein [Bacteroidales bacterium]|nr:polysaccharide biosynthesis/export family protein [Bacteroidales bacterium]MCF8454745.1 polysaccharide biosynthesis/export family protein [Bacteroidales bacterium]